MAQTTTDLLQEARLTVVAVRPERHEIRVRGAAEACSDVACSEGAVVVSDGDARFTLANLNPGDIVRLEPIGGRPERIVVLRRVWDELTSPEF